MSESETPKDLPLKDQVLEYLNTLETPTGSLKLGVSSIQLPQFYMKMQIISNLAIAEELHNLYSLLEKRFGNNSSEVNLGDLEESLKEIKAGG